VIEGITEFLPVSSTGHLLVAADLLRFERSAGGTFEIFIQFGAVLALLAFYGSELLAQARALRHDPAVRHLWLCVAVAFLPVVVVGLALRNWIKEVLFASPALIAWALIVGGVVFIVVERRPRRPLLIALALSSGFLVVEVIGALLTGSLALLADAGHMLTDVAALALALGAFWLSGRPATPERTYGFQRAEVLAAAANAATLVLIAFYIFYEAYQRLWDPPAVQSGPMLLVALAGLLANLASAWVLGHGHGGNLKARGAFLHVLTDMLGSVGALAAAAVMLATGWLYADPLASVLIGLLTLWSGWTLLRESVDVLLEATPRGVDPRAIEEALQALPGGVGMHDLHVWTVTSGFLALSAHLTAVQPAPEGLLVRATDLVRERFGVDHVTLQIEAPVEEELVHHGCYVCANGTACAAPPRLRRVAAAHRH
jgi:cobalt-zinc-cadmium efflux system protein